MKNLQYKHTACLPIPRQPEKWVRVYKKKLINLSNKKNLLNNSGGPIFDSFFICCMEDELIAFGLLLAEKIRNKTTEKRFSNQFNLLVKEIRKSKNGEFENLIALTPLRLRTLLLRFAELTCGEVFSKNISAKPQ